MTTQSWVISKETPEAAIASLLSNHVEILPHSIKVFGLVKHVVDRLPENTLSSSQVGDLLMAALLHDLGKAYWKDAWFQKPRHAITEVEWKMMNRHPSQAVASLEDWELVNSSVLHIIAEHHERPGGRGYPCGIEPDLSVIILAACDVYAACTEERTYRKQVVTREKALAKVATFAPKAVVKALSSVGRVQ
jgi:HD-GYP domain-containing protein (c-di-GMP phosphodiesterase class II)